MQPSPHLSCTRMNIVKKKFGTTWPLFFFFFSLKNKIKYSFKIRRYRNFSEFSPEKYISNDIKKKEKERKKYRRCGRGKTFLFVKNTKCLVDVHDSPSILEISPSSTKYGNRYRVAIYRCSKDWIRNIGEKFEIGR